MKLKRLIPRSLKYFRIGYSHVLHLPFALVGYATTFYYLAIENIPFLKELFPQFRDFILLGLVVLYPLAALIGWIWLKWKLKAFYEAEMDINVEANPYASEKFNPVMRVLAETILEIAEEHDIDASELKQIIEASTE